MTKDEALKLAIKSFDKIDMSNQSNEECARGWFIEGYVQALEQPAQEPVAWVKDNLICPENNYETTITEEHPKDLGWTPLYTNPAPSWQGLSDDEILEIDKSIDPKISIGKGKTLFARAIEQALKQKNFN